jgi:hypothetical protein
MGERAVTLHWRLQIDTAHGANAIGFGDAIFPKSGLSCPEQKLAGRNLVDGCR